MKNCKKEEFKKDLKNLLLVVFIPFLLTSIYPLIRKIENDVIYYIAYFSLGIVELVILLLLIKISDTRFSDFGFSLKKLPKNILIALGFILLSFIAAILIGSVINVPGTEPIEKKELTFFWFSVEVIYAFVYVALVEEVDRILVFLRAEKLFGTYGAYFLSALLFALSHIWLGWITVVYALAGGLILNLVWLLTKRNLLPAVIVHGGYNLINALLQDYH